VSRVLFLATALGWLAGCSAGFREANAENKASLRRRAAFDLDCSEKLRFMVLSKREDHTLAGGDALVTSYAVRGCGQRASYVLLGGGAWSLNAIAADGEQPRPGGNKRKKAEGDASE
jgi:hypothetical protein